MASVKPVNSIRFTPITRTRRSCMSPTRQRTIAPWFSAAKASPTGSVAGALVDRGGDPGRRDFSGDDALAGIGLDAIDAARFPWQSFPDRQQQARNDMERRLDEFREIGDLLSPGPRESLSIRFTPMRLAHPASRKSRALHRAHQSHALFDIAVVGHHAERGNLHRRATGLGVDEEKRARIARGARARLSSVKGFGRSR